MPGVNPGLWVCLAPRRGLLEANVLVCAEVVEVGAALLWKRGTRGCPKQASCESLLAPPVGALGIEETALGESVVIVTVCVLPRGAVGVGVIS